MEKNALNCCTFCKKEFDDFKIHLKLSIRSFRKKESDIWEEIANSDVTSNEILCKDCFDFYAESLDELMKKKVQERG